LHVHRHHSRSQRHTDHDGGQTDAPGAVNRQPLPRFRAPLLDYGSPGRGEPASKAGRRDVVDAVRKRHEILRRMVHMDQLGKGPPPGETRLLLMVTDLLMAGEALGTATAPGDERNRDPLAHPPTPDRSAKLLDDPGQLMARNMGQGDVRIMPTPAVVITAAHAGRGHADDGTVRIRRRVWHGANLDRPVELFIDRCDHGIGFQHEGMEDIRTIRKMQSYGVPTRSSIRGGNGAVLTSPALDSISCSWQPSGTPTVAPRFCNGWIGSPLLELPVGGA
jgi:hypothetical protein